MARGILHRRGKALTQSDLPRLRAQLHEISNQYLIALSRAEKRRLRQIESAISDGRSDDSLSTIRGLLAFGAVSFLSHATPGIDGPPRHLAVDVATSALMPVVLARKLPDDWAGVLASVSSQTIAIAVAGVRRHNSHRVDASRQLWSVIALPPSAAGIGRLLKDLTSEAGGGPYIYSLCHATGIHAAPRTPLDILKLAALSTSGAAAAGIVGNRADELAQAAWGEVTTLTKGLTGTEDLDPSEFGDGLAWPKSIDRLDDLFTSWSDN